MNNITDKRIVVAGHICLDITPVISVQSKDQISNILTPGCLIGVDGADIHTGGAVANTGLAMKKLGADVTLIGKIGDDPFGDIVAGIMDSYGVSDGLIRQQGIHTSYSVIIAIPGMDRIFLHDSGANDSFCLDDIPMSTISEAALFHFGYPPIMRNMYKNDGVGLISMFKAVKSAGAATSMDMAAIDSGSDSGRADWRKILKGALPYTDIFVPSIEELMYMLDCGRYEDIRTRSEGRDFTDIVDIDSDVLPLAEECIRLGAGIVLIKCGAPGMYLMTADRERLECVGKGLELNTEAWSGISCFKKSFIPDRVLSGTGAGDTSVAAFLTSVSCGYDPDKCLDYAAAMGACCVTGYDALSGLRSFHEIDAMIASGWARRN